jgi:hypothetical protein
MSFKTFFLILAVAGALYYGWPVVEKILLTLPIPDPKDVKEKIQGAISKTTKGGSK